ncbi:MAG: Cof-type HAD-IIB family hydrolase [Lachnospiraceae bacterium]|nr:Cof-type HAD-IIB family hydrolase [Lachnospiraceae bacterium]
MQKLLVMDAQNYAQDMEEIYRVAVRGIIFVDGKLALIENDFGEMKLPGGGIEEGESDEQALIREVKEETGYEVIPESITPFGEIEEKRASTFEPKIWHQISRLYFCEVRSERSACAYTDTEKELGFKPVLCTLEEAIAKNAQMLEKEGKQAWNQREYKTLLLIRDAMKKLLLFDLDGTLLRSDKTISERTLLALEQCRKNGYLIGVATSRSEQNCLTYLGALCPDIMIASGGALVKKGKDYIHKAFFTAERTRELITTARKICGADVEITIDTLDAHYWNYKTDPLKEDKNWGESIWTDYRDFSEEALKMCVEIFDEKEAKALADRFSDCDVIRFSDGCWYKFTKKDATKENAIRVACEQCSISLQNVISFGDDFADIGMLKMAGTGVAVGNALDEVKQVADVVIGSNDEDGIAEYLEKFFP